MMCAPLKPAEIDVQFNTVRLGVLVAVAVGTDVYGATDIDPRVALERAARSASDDLARRGHLVNAASIIEQGQTWLAARSGRSSTVEPRQPAVSADGLGVDRAVAPVGSIVSKE
jgi:hypothetical protein